MFSISVATQSGGDSGNAMAQAVAEDDNEAAAEEVEITVDGETQKGSDMFVFPVTVQTLLF
jgi:hypothetical protein